MSRYRSSTHILKTLAILALPLAQAAFGQTASLALSSGTATNGTVSLNLTLTSPAGSEPAAVQWTLNYAPTAITSISAVAGPAATNAGKTLTCSASSGAYTCLVTGMNSNRIANGTVAIVNATIATGVSSTSVTFSGTAAASPTGSAMATAQTGGTITGPGGSNTAPSLNQLSCSPTSITTPGSATCTVSLSAPAPSGGISVGLSDNNTSLSLPASVVVAAGASSAAVTATASSVTYSQSATVTAAYGGVSKSAALILNDAGSTPTNYSIWSPSNTPATITVQDVQPVELGLKFQSSSAGYVTGVKFYKGPQNTGTHVGHLWSGTGSLLATAPFSNESASGWQQVSFPSPVSIAANTMYVISYQAPVGYYSGDNGFFASSVTNGPLTALASTNGVYAYGNSAFPTNSFKSTNYWVDVIFTTGSAAPAPVSLTSLQCSPATLASGAASTCQVTLSGAAPAGGTTVSLSDNSTALTVPASVTVPAGATTAGFSATAGTISVNQTAVVTASLNGASQTASIALTVPLVSLSSLQCSPTTLSSGATSTCTVTLSGAAPTGGTVIAVANSSAAVTVPASVTVAASARAASFTATAAAVTSPTTAVVTATLSSISKTASFTVNPPSQTSYSIWDSTAKPANVTDSDTQAVELGLKFRSSVAGNVTGVRFYKGSQNTGTHVGHLWTKSGALLASVTFTGETASGWQQANFANPVTIAANTTYVISYRSPSGHYSGDNNYFSTSGVTNGPLQALQDGQDGPNSVYHYGKSIFPNAGYQGSNYWVDVVFSPSTTTVSTTAKKPGALKAAADSTRSAQTAVASSLSCSPKAVQAGSSFTCELQLNDASEPVEVGVEDSSSNVMLPATVTTRANQHSLTFHGSVNEGAPQESFTVSASIGDQTVEDSLVAVPASGPAISVPGDQFVKYGTAVHFKVSAYSAGPVDVAAADLPAGASFDPNTGRFEWTPLESQQGGYDVKFTAASAARTVHLDVGPGLPVVRESSQFACSPGAIASLAGMWLADGEPMADPSAGSMELSGTKVRVNGAYVPVLYASQGEARFLCPDVAAGEALEIVLETSSGVAQAVQTTMREASPSLLSTEGNSQGLILRVDSAKVAAIRDVRTGGEPAQPADSISIRATGLGDNLPLFVKIGDAYAEVGSIAPVEGVAGVWDIQAKVPSGVVFGDAVPVQLEVASNGQALASNTVTIALEPVRP